MNWYYIAKGRSVGPVLEEEFSKLIAAGTIRRATLVWHKGMTDWQAYGKIDESVAASVVMEYAGFWIRVGAKLIDGLILGICQWLLTVAIQVVFSLLGTGQMLMIVVLSVLIALWLFVPVLYSTFFVGCFAATPGKMACSIKIVTGDGERVGYARAAGRFFAEILSSLFFCLGYFILVFDKEKRALHDYICNTRVVRVVSLG